VVTPPVIDPPVEPPPVFPPTVDNGFVVIPENMFPGLGGWSVSENLSTHNKAVLRVRLNTPILPGDTVRIEYEQKTNIVLDGTKNLKDFRASPGPGMGDYPNDYTGRSVGSGSHSLTAENNDGDVIYKHKSPQGWNVAYFVMPIKRDVVQRIVREFRYSSKPGEPDGWARVTVDAKKVFEGDGMVLNASRRDFCPQMVYANPGKTGSLPSNAYYNARIISVERVP
jgi:hypothetical protein